VRRKGRGPLIGPKFGPKHRDTQHNQAVLDIIVGQRKAYKNLHKMTERYRLIRTPSYFKTGAARSNRWGSGGTLGYNDQLRRCRSKVFQGMVSGISARNTAKAHSDRRVGVRLKSQGRIS
jgi:hypothetical protein